jgi:hypothetical protein
MRSKVGKAKTAAGLGLLLLTGCPKEWHVAITDVQAGPTPRFCVTKRPGCNGDGTWVSMFIVDQVADAPSQKQTRKPVWWIEPAKRGATLHYVVYGVTPPGYRQVVPPQRLELGRIYQIHDDRFRLREKAGRLSYEVLPTGELK